MMEKGNEKVYEKCVATLMSPQSGREFSIVTLLMEISYTVSANLHS